MPWGKEAGNLVVHSHFFNVLAADAGRAAKQVNELVHERDVELALREAVLDRDEACGEVDFGESHIGDATADGEFLRVTKQRVEQLEKRRNLVHGADSADRVVAVTDVWVRGVESSPRWGNFSMNVWLPVTLALLHPCNWCTCASNRS
ncbi:hypothetical protein GCM10017774_76790 [Lentzea cavernae]|uniref:Uncharacterized protein n=1 Tax=Lentzea cavernae TaxID=2020703 RepID=A0ABQ3N0P2_9PSEU|nr:hypothetical protein GCM10017774_76790 [Lentzea cavernae]